MKTTYMSEKKGITSRFLLLAQTLLITNLFLPSIAFAYVDPGSGSVIVTTILGLIAAIGYTFRKYFYKMKRLISGKKTEKNQEGQD